MGAVLYRRRPEIHKRLILLATTALLFAAVGRMTFLSRPVALPVWLSPVLIGIAYDAWTRRRVHPTYVIGLVVLLIGFSRLFLTQTEAWLRIGRALIGVFA